MSEQAELLFMGKSCSHCGKEASKLTEVKGKLFCDDCFSILYFYCSKCKEYKSKNERHTVRDSGGYGKISVILALLIFTLPVNIVDMVVRKLMLGCGTDKTIVATAMTKCLFVLLGIKDCLGITIMMLAFVSGAGKMNEGQLTLTT